MRERDLICVAPKDTRHEIEVWGKQKQERGEAVNGGAGRWGTSKEEKVGGQSHKVYYWGRGAGAGERERERAARRRQAHARAAPVAVKCVGRGLYIGQCKRVPAGEGKKNKDENPERRPAACGKWGNVGQGGGGQGSDGEIGPVLGREARKIEKKPGRREREKTGSGKDAQRRVVVGKECESEQRVSLG